MTSLHSQLPLRALQVLSWAWVGCTALAFAWIVMASGMSSADFLEHPLGTHASWASFAKNYAYAWHTAQMGRYFLNSALITLGAVAFSALLAAPAAYALALLPVPRKSLIVGALSFALAVPGFLIVTPLFLDYHRVAIGGFTVLNSRLGITLVYTALALPFSIFVLAAFYKKLPPELSEAAAIDGASPWTIFRDVYFPLSGPGLATVMIFNFLTFWNEYNLALILLTDPDALTLPVGLYNLALSQRYAQNIPVVFAGIALVCAPTVVVFLVLQRRIVKGLTLGAFSN